MRYLAVIALLALAGCGGDRYRVVEGPARVNIGSTPWTPGATVEVEAGGRMWFGPDGPTGAVNAPVPPEEAPQ